MGLTDRKILPWLNRYWGGSDNCLMRLAFCLFNYFPYGGLERNFRLIAEECTARGHEVDVYTMQWKGPRAGGLNIHFIPAEGWSNHRKIKVYTEYLQIMLKKKPVHLVIGFNKMPGLDLYYAGDTCYLARIRRDRGILSRLTPRYKSISNFEKAVFSPESRTEIIYISAKEKQIYQEYYETPESRFHYAPPGVNKDFIRSCLSKEKRDLIRSKLGLAENDNLLLMIGSNFFTKGVDRSIKALASLPESLFNKTFLIIIGEGKKKKYRLMADRLNIGDKVIFMGGRDDVPSFLASADLVMQPSLNENTGNPIVEAIVAGVPVLATENCGFSEHIRASGAGKVIPSNPFDQKIMNRFLQDVLLNSDKEKWRQRALAYADQVDLYSRIPAIADIIEGIGRTGT
ncbi:MAG: glycosyltransferase family 4 protein [Thermodesulfobacteriota bacterium]